MLTSGLPPHLPPPLPSPRLLPELCSPDCVPDVVHPSHCFLQRFLNVRCGCLWYFRSAQTDRRLPRHPERSCSHAAHRGYRFLHLNLRSESAGRRVSVSGVPWSGSHGPNVTDDRASDVRHVLSSPAGLPLPRPTFRGAASGTARTFVLGERRLLFCLGCPEGEWPCALRRCPPRLAPDEALVWRPQRWGRDRSPALLVLDAAHFTPREGAAVRTAGIDKRVFFSGRWNKLWSSFSPCSSFKTVCCIFTDCSSSVKFQGN